MKELFREGLFDVLVIKNEYVKKSDIWFFGGEMVVKDFIVKYMDDGNVVLENIFFLISFG